MRDKRYLSTIGEARQKEEQRQQKRSREHRTNDEKRTSAAQSQITDTFTVIAGPDPRIALVYLKQEKREKEREKGGSPCLSWTSAFFTFCSLSHHFLAPKWDPRKGYYVKIMCLLIESQRGGCGCNARALDRI